MSALTAFKTIILFSQPVQYRLFIWADYFFDLIAPEKADKLPCLTIIGK